MGYHIVNIENGNLKHDFVESYEELSYIEFITEDSIIYQGEKHWKPFKVSDHEKYKHFSKGWFRAGIQAQELFKEQASSQGYILEELNQDQKSFISYTTNVNKIPIKRGDFLIRNFANIEIDIKCRSFMTINGKQYFDFKCEDVTKHSNMQNFTNTPILIAVYENIKSRPVEEDVFMFSINSLVENKKIEIHYRKNIGNCYRIPIDFTVKGFQLIDDIYNKITYNKTGTYSIENKRLFNSNAYKKWTKKEDEKLEKLYCKNTSVNQLSNILGRNKGAIRSRINKLELIEKYKTTSM